MARLKWRLLTSSPTISTLISENFGLQHRQFSDSSEHNSRKGNMKWIQTWLGATAFCWLLFTFNTQATTHYVDANGINPISPFTDWSTAATNIQDAIDASTDGDLIVVADGVYATGGRVVYGALTNRVVINKAVTVQSVNGPGLTTIQGYQIPAGSTAYSNNVRCVYMTNDAVLSGFTIVNGATLATSASTDRTNVISGGGVYCESASSVLTNCVLSENLCYGQNSSAGGGAVFQGSLNNCIISNNMISTNVLSYGAKGGGALRSILNDSLIADNSASFGGGAAYSILNRCSVVGNIAPFYGSTSWGGGTYMCTANDCLIVGNISTTAGGGDCLGILNRCILSNNICMLPLPNGNGSGGGSYQQSPNGSYFPALNNCLIVSNFCYGSGGGVYFSGTTVPATNCTIIGNTATNQGGGAYSGALKNSIVYGNYCTSISYGFSSNIFQAKLTNCWSTDPNFANPANGDFHLSSNSPCINSGNDAYVSVTNDLDGNPRIVGGTVDIGAYEYQTPSSILSYAWAQQYGLPTDGTADSADTDGDGMNNFAEWKASTDPTNALSLLQLASPVFTNSPDGIVVTWQSVTNVTYYLQRSSDLSGAFSVMQSNLIGRAGFTSYADISATNAGPYFYRVGVQ
jgi:hypothetical protein